MPYEYLHVEWLILRLSTIVWIHIQRIGQAILALVALTAAKPHGL